jgi:hypothetical protein
MICKVCSRYVEYVQVGGWMFMMLYYMTTYVYVFGRASVMSLCIFEVLGTARDIHIALGAYILCLAFWGHAYDHSASRLRVGI